MNTAVLVLSLANLALIGALPRLFFRPGRLNLMWWITAAPFFAAAGALCAGMAGVLEPIGPAVQPAEWASTLASAASILVIGFTLGTHQEPLSLWHQEDATPNAVVTRGAYRRIRHPFYAAFLLALLASALALPHWITLLCFLLGGFQLNHTARVEEQRLLLSDRGTEYARYRTRTGRFFPRIGRGRHGPKGEEQLA